MEHLHAYVPEVDGELLPILCSGDGLSVERMSHAKRARTNADTKKDRLHGLVECPQEFHKEVILLQVKIISNSFESMTLHEVDNGMKLQQHCL